MPRISRADSPGSWHHVINRGIAKRTIFERRDDFRVFMAQLACAARRGEIEVHAYCLLSTHFHLLLRSPRGELAAAMQRVQLAYSRYFNRSRKRDGSLVRGRYFSKRVRSLTYRRALVRYIDANPCNAKIVRTPLDYPYGSALHYAKASGPPWLTRTWIEESVRLQTGTFSASNYARAFCKMPAELACLIEARMFHRGRTDPLDNLVSASCGHVRDWMVRKARLADGTAPDMPVVSLERLARVVASERKEVWRVRQGQVDRDAWPVALAGLGRDLCGLSISRLAEHLELSQSTASKLYRIHSRQMSQEEDYSERAARVAHRALQGWRGA